MAFFENKIVLLDELLTMTFEGKGPKEFSFLGVIDTQKTEQDANNPFRFNHDLILHNGSKSRIHIQYITGHDDENEYDNRIVDDSLCPFYPKASTCFLPRLQILYAENDDLYCNFKGGDLTAGRMIESSNAESNEERQVDSNIVTRKIRRIGSNRVCLLLDMLPSSIYEFIFNNEVISLKLNSN